MAWFEILGMVLGSNVLVAVTTWLLNRRMYITKVEEKKAEIESVMALTEDQEVTTAGKIVKMYDELIDRLDSKIDCLSKKLNVQDEKLHVQDEEIKQLRAEIAVLRKENENSGKSVKTLKRRMRMLAKLVLDIYESARAVNGIGCLEDFIGALKMPAKDEDYLLEIIAEVNEL